MLRTAFITVVVGLFVGQVPDEVGKKLPGKGKIDWDFSEITAFWKVVDVKQPAAPLTLTFELGKAEAPVIEKGVKSVGLVNVFTKSGTGLTEVNAFTVFKVKGGKDAVAFDSPLKNFKPILWTCYDDVGNALAKGPLTLEYRGKKKEKSPKIRSGETVAAVLMMPPPAVIIKTAKIVVKFE